MINWHFITSIYIIIIQLRSLYRNVQENVSQQITWLPMLFQCWANVEDGGPALTQHTPPQKENACVRNEEYTILLLREKAVFAYL